MATVVVLVNVSVANFLFLCLGLGLVPALAGLLGGFGSDLPVNSRALRVGGVGSRESSDEQTGDGAPEVGEVGE